ncbi:Peroxiredoxin-like 2C [Apodemus speciosus]|uniref:Peroxiredoxin-like 2C n=1 Tax=Apodemus speciosus TaxID=105296 RepID=A0ABQ0FGB0_APOSI
MAAPVTRQVSGCAGRITSPASSDAERGQPLAAAVAELPVLDASGRRVTFGTLFRERRAVVVFVRHFLCYVCKEYVEDLAKIPKSFLREADVTLIVIGQSSYHHIEPFCKLTGYSHEIYVDPEREIYKRLGMKRGEEISSSGCGHSVADSLSECDTNDLQPCSPLCITSQASTVFFFREGQSPHIKSNLLSGSLQSLWRAVTGPLFDFQGDPAQQGGTFILGPGEIKGRLLSSALCKSKSHPLVLEPRTLKVEDNEVACFGENHTVQASASVDPFRSENCPTHTTNIDFIDCVWAKDVSSSILGNNIHFVHRDRNRLDHKPINSVLQLVGVQPVNFMSRPTVIHV